MRFALALFLACAACGGDGRHAPGAQAPDAAPSALDSSDAPGEGAPDAAAEACERAVTSARCAVGFLCATSASCWSAAIDCASAVDCDGDGKLDLACPCGQRARCETRTCGATAGAPPPRCAQPVEDARCPEELPLYCPDQASCVLGPTVDCASLRDCDGDGVFESTCGCGLAVDCATHTCRSLARLAPIAISGGNSEEDQP